ncbi:hypothetical protein GGS21DRAFT_494777 [Xylaria nigripes]|nr:hypothetical protein GGS21DRAFT_494777 [Xylaria nigripes]
MALAEWSAAVASTAPIMASATADKSQPSTFIDKRACLRLCVPVSLVDFKYSFVDYHRECYLSYFEAQSDRY